MTNEKKYTLLVKMIREYDDAATLDGLGEKAIERPDMFAHSDVSPFLACAAELLLDVQAAMDRGTTSAETLAALKRIYNNCPVSRPDLDGFSRSGDMWALCDGFRFIRLHSKPGSIPEAQPTPGDKSPIDLEKLAQEALEGAEDVELPTAGRSRPLSRRRRRSTDPRKTGGTNGKPFPAGTVIRSSCLTWCRPFPARRQ